MAVDAVCVVPDGPVHPDVGGVALAQTGPVRVGEDLEVKLVEGLQVVTLAPVETFREKRVRDGVVAGSGSNARATVCWAAAGSPLAMTPRASAPRAAAPPSRMRVRRVIIGLLHGTGLRVQQGVGDWWMGGLVSSVAGRSDPRDELLLDLGGGLSESCCCGICHDTSGAGPARSGSRPPGAVGHPRSGACPPGWPRG